MKFDLSRVLEDVETFSGPRFGGSPEEIAARDALAARLSPAGWHLSQIPVVAVREFRNWQRYLSWAGVLAIPVSTNQSLPTSVRVAALALVILTLIFARARPEIVPAAPNVKARLAGSFGERPQLFLITRIETPRPHWSRSRSLLSRLFPAVLLTLSYGLDSPRKLLFFILGGLLLLFVFDDRLRPFRNRGGVGPSDNRTGLALCAELSRSLPRSVLERIDLHCIAIGGGLIDRVESMEFVVGTAADHQSRLVVLLDSPAVGVSVRISSLSEAALAEEAARDLWIPYRLVSPPFKDSRLPAMIRISGEDLPGAEVEPRLFQPVVHLVGEVALRWARSKEAKGELVSK